MQSNETFSHNLCKKQPRRFVLQNKIKLLLAA